MHPLRQPRRQRLAIYGAVAFISFLLGLSLTWFAARWPARERIVEQQTDRLSRLEGTLDAAAVQARRGDYEPARQAVSTFFTSLRAELDGERVEFTEAQRKLVQGLLAQRDQLITLLARADPAGAERLTRVQVAYQQVIGHHRVQGRPVGARTPVPR
jgi:hypothetical protein